MSELEDFIKKNKEQFELQEPTDGHLERFIRKLDKEEESKKTSVVTFWRVAAAIIILVAVSVSVLLPRFNTTDDVQYASMTLGDVSEDLAEVELYYESKLEKEYEALNELSQSDPEVKAYMDELEKLNEVYKELESQLYSSASHEKLVLAMIENFRLRLSLIEKLEEKKSEITDETSYNEVNKTKVKKQIRKSRKSMKKNIKQSVKSRKRGHKTHKQTKIYKT